MVSRKRKTIDLILKIMTYGASALSVFILGAILIFIFSRGTKLLNMDVILGDNDIKTYTYEIMAPEENVSFQKPSGLDDTKDFFSQTYGIVLSDDYDLSGHKTIILTYMDNNSPFKSAYYAAINEYVEVPLSLEFSTGMLLTYRDGVWRPSISADIGAEAVVKALDLSVSIDKIPLSTQGGGIRGSIIATFYLVILTLLVALPVGIFTALYLHEMAPQTKLIQIIRSFVDMLTGIPSIIYGLMGAAFFIPLTNTLSGGSISEGSLISGSLTLAVIVLPVIIRSTESALDVVPAAYKEASLSLGTTQTQTTLKIMLPNAMPGILSATLLAIGRIIGESAALIYAVGSVIKDQISIGDKGTSLAVHIWTAMAGETPNLDLASTIAIIILAVVLTLNLLVKLITYRFTKKYAA